MIGRIYVCVQLFFTKFLTSEKKAKGKIKICVFFYKILNFWKNIKRKDRKICVVAGCVRRSHGAENNTGQSRHLRLLNPVWLTEEEMLFCDLTWALFWWRRKKDSWTWLKVDVIRRNAFFVIWRLLYFREEKNDSWTWLKVDVILLDRIFHQLKKKHFTKNVREQQRWCR